MCLLPLFASTGTVRMLIFAHFLAMFAMSWDIISGRTGYISFELYRVYRRVYDLRGKRHEFFEQALPGDPGTRRAEPARATAFDAPVPQGPARPPGTAPHLHELICDHGCSAHRSYLQRKQ